MDGLIIVLCIALYVVEYFTDPPIIKGFLRLRCILKLIFPYSLLVAYFSKNVSFISYDFNNRINWLFLSNYQKKNLSLIKIK